MKYGHYQMIVTDSVINEGEDDEANVLDRTWKDISDAFNAGHPVVITSEVSTGVGVAPVIFVGEQDDAYIVVSGDVVYGTEDENGFPYKSGS